MTGQSDFAFTTLTPETILDALAMLGIDVDSGLIALNSYENRVYQFIDSERQRKVVKFYRPARWDEAQLQQEHDFIDELYGQEIPVVPPLKYCEHTLHHHHGFYFAVFPSVGGRSCELDNMDQLEWIGRFIGRIHEIGKRSLFDHRINLDLAHYLYPTRQVFEETLLLPSVLKRSFLSSLDVLIGMIEHRWDVKHLERLRIHGDCHAGNILWREGPLFVDFDDVCNGFAIQDLWMLLSGEASDQRYQLDILLEGYEEFCDFDRRELALIEVLRAIRMVYYLAWQTSRWHDKAFQLAFPWLKDEGFWQTQLSLLTQQAEKLKAPPLLMQPYY